MYELSKQEGYTLKKILIIMGGYLPGYKYGGPVQTVKNMTDCLGEEYDFRVLTVDRDYGDSAAYPNICYNEWNFIGNTKVWYVKPNGFNKNTLRQLEKDIDLIYVFGCFENYARLVMYMKRTGNLDKPVVMAPMGCFSPGAFRIKYVKKKTYITACRLLGWFKNIVWCVTGEQDQQDVWRIIGKDAVCYLAENIPRQMEYIPAPIPKAKGMLRVVFLSRISPKKNLDYALEVLQKVKGNVAFDIYGVMEDSVYFSYCQEKMKALPENVICQYHGGVEPHRTLEVFGQYHVFLFPTKGENFGHVIYEAMAGGCIPVISDRCPWGNLEQKQAGRVLPLEDKDAYVKAVQELIDMDSAQYERWQKRAAEYAWEFGKQADGSGYRKVFELENGQA